MNHQQPLYRHLLLTLFLALALLVCSVAALGLPVRAAHQPAAASAQPHTLPFASPSETYSPTSTSSDPSTPTPTDTPTATATSTFTATATSTSTSTPTATATSKPPPHHPATSTATGTPTPTSGAGTATPTHTPALALTPPATANATPSPVPLPGGNGGSGDPLTLLFQLPLPGGLLLGGGLLGILALTVVLHRHLNQSVAQSQSAAPAAQVDTEAWPQPSFPDEGATPAFAPDPASAPPAADISEIDTLFLLAAVRLAPEGVAVDSLLEAAPRGDGPAPTTEADVSTQAPAAPPDALAATSEASAPEAASLEPAASTAAPEAIAAPPPGFLYWLGEPFGPGVAGTLYYAEAQPSHDPKAIKFFSSRYFGQPRLRQQFLQHAHSLTLLDDPHLLRVEEVGMYEQRGYLVRPYLNGGSLAERLETPLTLRATWRYLRPLTKVLDYLHECQVLHLHLTPQNILFDEADQLYLSDAGLVTLLMELAQENDAAFSVPASSAIAPEQQAGEPDWRSDLYSLGVLLYQMLAGREAISAHGDQPPRPPFLRALRPNLPIALEDVLAQAMAENPAERYQSAEAIAMAFYTAVGPASSARISQEAPG